MKFISNVITIAAASAAQTAKIQFHQALFMMPKVNDYEVKASLTLP
jgi:hypothetical protein